MPQVPPQTRRILGIDFFDGSATAAIAIMRDGGLLVIPAAPALKDLNHNLEYLRELLLEPDVRQPGNTLWIMASPISAKRNLDWLEGQGITVPEDNIYMAPIYGSASISDPALLERLNRLRPQHVIMTIGGGTQERLGLYLKRNLDYRPAIHCIGAAIAFLSGDQVHIPVWADRFYLGWLFRSVAEPKRYVPRYWGAFKLLPLMLRHRESLPNLKP